MDLPLRDTDICGEPGKPRNGEERRGYLPRPLGLAPPYRCPSARALSGGLDTSSIVEGSDPVVDPECLSAGMLRRHVILSPDSCHTDILLRKSTRTMYHVEFRDGRKSLRAAFHISNAEVSNSASFHEGL